MNNKIIVIWGFIIFGLIISIYLLGLNYNKKEDYKEFKETLKLSVDNYMSDYETWPDTGKFEISLEELKNNNYINSLEYNGRTCSGNIKVMKNENKYNYEYEIECVKEITD